MPKKKRTLKQKQVADKRRSTIHTGGHTAPVTHTQHRVSPDSTLPAAPAETTTGTFSLPTHYTTAKHSTHPLSRGTTTTIATDEYGYLGKDLVKTALLTIIIIVVEVLLHLFAKI